MHHGLPVPTNLPKAEPLEKRPDILDPTRPRYDPTTKTYRYRAGRVPKYAQREESFVVPTPPQQVSPSSSEDEDSSSYLPSPPKLAPPPPSDFTALRRRKIDSDDDEEDRRQPSDEIAAKEDEDEENMQVDEGVAERLPDSDEEEERRRQKRRERETFVKPQPQDHSSQTVPEEDDLPKADEGDTDDEDSSDEDSRIPALAKPVFKAKDQRTALLAALEEEAAKAEAEEQAEEERKRTKADESKTLLVKTVKELEEAQERERLRNQTGCDTELLSDCDLPDDEISDEEKEYELWKRREMGRLQRDYLQNQRRQLEEAEVERRRKMSESERRKDDRKLDAAAPKLVEQGRMAFMQKYYHKGAFFQDVVSGGSEDVFQKDFNAAIAEEAIDKELLPSVMRVRRGDWGRKSRSKHTHLRDVDTTDRTAAWAQAEVLKPTFKKLGGLKGSDELDRPAVKRRKGIS